MGPLPGHVWAGRARELPQPADAEHEGAAVGVDPAALELLDLVLGAWHDRGTRSDEVAEGRFCFGCLVGQVFVDHADGEWVATPAEDREVLLFPFVVVLPDGRGVDPVERAFRRLDVGEAESVAYPYQVLVAGEGPTPSP